MNSLIVEDDPTARFILSKWLQKFGSCESVSTGEEGIEAYKLSLESGYPFEFLSLDINLPGIDGVEVLKKIREIEKEAGLSSDQKCKILMATSDEKSSTVMASFKGECNGYMTKPFHRKVLLDHLKKMKLIGVQPGTVKESINCLIVEDDRSTRFILDKWLSEKGNCMTAEDGKTGLDMFITAYDSEQPYDLVILDINMPILNGLDVLKGIRDYERGMDMDLGINTKVIMVTGDGNSEVVMKAFGENCDGYITKPLAKKKMDELLKKLHLVA